MAMEISGLRREVDKIDEEIVELLKERFKRARFIGEKKSAADQKIVDEEREREVLENYKKKSKGELDEYFIEKLVKILLEYSKEVQRQ